MSATSSVRLSITVLAGAAVFFAHDIASDLLTGADSMAHIMVELLVFVAITAVLATDVNRVRRLRNTVDQERQRSARLAGELLSVMRAQFDAWGLSRSEAEVALLLIKGLSMKEIADAREVKEKTVRSQAATIYAKSGRSGRHELAAYFIEDLFSAN